MFIRRVSCGTAVCCFSLFILSICDLLVKGDEGVELDGVEVLLEHFDLDNSTGLNESEVELYLRSIRGLDVAHCANTSQIFSAIGVPLSEEANSTEEITGIILAATQCVVESYCGTEFEVVVEGEAYHCAAEGHGHEERLLGEDDHDHGAGEEIELLWGNGFSEAEFHCVLEEEEETLPSSYSAQVWGYALGAVLLVSGISLICSGVLFFGVHRGLVSVSFLDKFLAFAVGILLWAAVVHVLPEAVEFYGGYDWQLGLAALMGVFASMSLEMLISHPDVDSEVQAMQEGKGLVIVEKSKPLNALALNIIWGDALHNFSDGVLIGLAFGACNDTSLGLAVTIAIICHEIPQELGDYLVLIKAGQAPLRALFYNVLSALSAVLGTVIVLSLGVVEPKTQGLLLAAAAGVLVFIAIGELFPSIVSGSDTRKEKMLRLILLLMGFGLGGLLRLIPHQHCEIGHSHAAAHSH